MAADRYALINKKTSTVVNVIIYDPEKNWQPPVGHFLVQSSYAGTGDWYNQDEGVFIRPVILDTEE